MAPVMKQSMKKASMKSVLSKMYKKGRSVLKKPSSALNLGNLNKLEMDSESVTASLNDKISQFEKRPTDMNTWLSRLSKQEREACWKRFEYDRKATPGANEGYQQAAIGKRSMGVKLDLLKAFLVNKSSCKGPAMQKAFMSHGITVGTKSKETWRPFVYMSQYYGVAQLFRRVGNGSILARKDGNEWQFKLVETTTYRDEHDAGGFHASSQGKLSDEKWADLQQAANHLQIEDGDKTMDKGLIKFLQDKTSGSSAKDVESDLPFEEHEDADVISAEKLSDLGTLGKKAKDRVVSAITLLQRVIEKTDDDDNKLLLNSHLKCFKKMSSDKVKIEDVKDKLIKAMQCIKKSKVKHWNNFG